MDVYHCTVLRPNGSPDPLEEPQGSLWHAAVGELRQGPVTVARWVRRAEGITLAKGSRDIFAGVPSHARFAVLHTLCEYEGEDDGLLPAIIRAVWTVSLDEGRRRALPETIQPRSESA